MRWLFYLMCFISINASAQTPVNNEYANAINISNTDSFCSPNGFYTNLEATPSSYPKPQDWPAVGNDVWFKFTALKFDVNITVSGKSSASSINTLQNPLVALYTSDPASGSFNNIPGNMVSSNNVTSYYKGALTIGQIYYVRVSATNNNMGTFQLCVNNYFPPLAPGQDCGTVSILCGMEKFTQLNVSGAGTNNKETAGTCLGQESNSAWYMWTAGKSGDFTFLITPTDITNDIDWVLYDLGPGGDCSQAVATNAIRCASGSGTNCNPAYYKTGLSLTETDLREEPGCVPGQNGLVRYVDMIAGHNYALIVDNFSSGNNGFALEFGGTTEFVGPTSAIQLEKLNSCTPQQSFTFTSLAANYTSLKWTFGEGASLASATTEGPFNITYSTQGEKIAVLEAKGTGGCDVVSTVRFFVANKPIKPTISASSIKLCYDDILKLTTPNVDLATYSWTGPNGFTSADQNPEIKITGPENSGDYTLFVQVGDCISEITTLNIPLIDVRPEALFDIIPNNLCLPNQYYTVLNKSLNYSKLVWDFGDGTNTIDINGNIKIVYTTTGLKKISLKVTSPNGCESTLTQEIDVQLKPATPIIASNKPAFCLGDVMKFSIEEIPGLAYQWSGPNNFKASTASIEIPVKDFNVAGIYQVYTTIGLCQSDVAKITIPPIAKIPVASFDTDPTFKFKFAAPIPIVFNNYSKDADSYLWDFGDGTTSIEANPTHIYQHSGTYRITLTAFADEGCRNAIVKGDLIISNAILFVPNAFSPNGDGVNDEFNVTVTNLKKYQLFIYNRAGENIFQTGDIFDNWKGTFKNRELPVGVYYYVIFGRTIYNQDVKYTGSLTLIR